MDLLLRDAWLIDATGAEGRAADVAVTGDRITAVAEPGLLTTSASTEVVCLDGLALAPGFIDIHTHYDAQILWDSDLTPSSWHTPCGCSSSGGGARSDFRRGHCACPSRSRQ